VIGVVVMMLAGAQMKYRMVNDNPSGGSFVPMMTKSLTLKAGASARPLLSSS
jgi:hypothetical protein